MNPLCGWCYGASPVIHLDICDVSVMEKLLRDLGLAAAAERLTASDAEQLAANAASIQKARGLMQTVGGQVVPTQVGQRRQRQSAAEWQCAVWQI